MALVEFVIEAVAELSVELVQWFRSRGDDDGAEEDGADSSDRARR